MNRRLVMTLALSLVSFGLALPMASHASTFQQIVPSDCNVNGGCNSICDIATLAQNILNDAIYLAVFLAAILFAWGGWKYLTAGGGGEVERARHMLTDVVIGLVIILAAWLIVATIVGMLMGTSPAFPWNQIC